MWHILVQSEHMLLEKWYQRLALCRILQTFNLQSAIKWDMSVCDNLTIEINNVCHGLQRIELK